MRRMKASTDRKANSHPRADAGPAIQNSGQRFPANAGSLCRLGHSEAKWIETKGIDDFSGVWRMVHSHDLASAVTPNDFQNNFEISSKKGLVAHFINNEMRKTTAWEMVGFGGAYIGAAPPELTIFQ